MGLFRVSPPPSTSLNAGNGAIFILLVDTRVALDGLESGLEDTKSCVMRPNRREMRTGSTEAEPTCSKGLLRGDPPDKGDQVGTPQKIDAVPPKCKAGRSFIPWRPRL